jgi:hypothetical protein
MWGHTTFTRTHRPAQHSLPVNNYPYTPTSNSSPKIAPQTDSPAAVRRFERSATDYPFSGFSENISAKIEPTHSRQSSMPKLQPSFSTSDIPTMRTAGGIQNSFGRGPIDRQRHSRDLSINAAVSNVLLKSLAGANIASIDRYHVWPSFVRWSWTHVSNDAHRHVTFAFSRSLWSLRTNQHQRN